MNIASMRNQGLNILVGTRGKVNSDLNYDVTLTDG